jgi:DNA-binding response OmpR family regulator
MFAAMNRPSIRILSRAPDALVPPVREFQLSPDRNGLEGSIAVLPIVYSLPDYRGLGSALAKRAPSLAVRPPRSVSVFEDLAPQFRAADQPDVVLLDCHTVRGAVMCRAVARVRLAGWRGPIFVIVGDQSLAKVPVAMTLGAAEFGLPTTSAAEIEVRLSRLVGSRDESVTTIPLPSGSLLAIHWRRHVVICDGIRVSLSLRELQLFGAMAENVGRTLTASDILRLAWGRGSESDSAAAVYVSALRRKLAWFGNRFGIRTIRGLGYRFEISTEASGLTTGGALHDE